MGVSQALARVPGAQTYPCKPPLWERGRPPQTRLRAAHPHPNPLP